MTFEEIYSSKSKYSQRIMDIEIGRKRIDPLLCELFTRLRRRVFNKSYEDFNTVEEFRKYLLHCEQITMTHISQRFAESCNRRFTQDEWDIIRAEHERQRIIKQIRRAEAYKNEYDLMSVPKETKEYLQYIDVLTMKKLGFCKAAIGKELNKSNSWVAIRYEERLYPDDKLYAHINNLNVIAEHIDKSMGIEVDSHYLYEALYVDFDQKKTIHLVACEINSCKRGCIGILKELNQEIDRNHQDIIIEKQNNFCNTFKECLCTLERREVEILIRYYGCSRERETLSAIAKSRNVSPVTIRQIRNKAIRKLRHPSRYKRIDKEYRLAKREET